MLCKRIIFAVFFLFVSLFVLSILLESQLNNYGFSVSLCLGVSMQPGVSHRISVVSVPNFDGISIDTTLIPWGIAINHHGMLIELVWSLDGISMECPWNVSWNLSGISVQSLLNFNILSMEAPWNSCVQCGIQVESQCNLFETSKRSCLSFQLSGISLGLHECSVASSEIVWKLFGVLMRCLWRLHEIPKRLSVEYWWHLNLYQIHNT